MISKVVLPTGGSRSLVAAPNIASGDVGITVLPSSSHTHTEVGIKKGNTHAAVGTEVERSQVSIAFKRSYPRAKVFAEPTKLNWNMSFGDFFGRGI